MASNLKLFKHQQVSVNFLTNNEKVADFSDPGCVSADTEFLTPSGWKRIDHYTNGDMVAQFHPDTREIEFVKPLDYIKRPCSTMIAIAPSRGTSQRLSHEHRVLYYKDDGSHDVMPAMQYMNTLHQIGPNHFKSKFCTTFSVRTHSALDLNDDNLRVMVAVIADGHFSTEGSTRCTIRIKKQRKIERLRMLLSKATITYKEKTCSSQPDFQVFHFNAPLRHKEFNSDWWKADQHQLEIIADELPNWDASQDKRPSAGTRFSTFVESTADFAQYAFSAAKRPTSKTFSIRNRTDEGRGVMLEFTVHAQAKNKLIGPGRKESVYEVPNPEGYKYCFEVPSSFLLLRHNGYIFATGNTGKTGVEIIAYAKRPKRKAALVIAPKSLLQAAWENDFRKFAPNIKCSVAFAHNRKKAMSAPADVYITNHDAVKDLLTYPASYWKKFDTLIVDESTAFKNHTSQRSKALAKLAKHFKYRRIMSGTPTSNGICDLWHQIYILDEGKRLGKSFTGFRNAVCVPEQVGPMPNMVKWHDKEGIEEKIYLLLHDIVIRHKFEECVDIPANHTYSLSYELPKKHMAHYTELQDSSLLLINESSISAVNGAVLYTKLLQAASGAAYDDYGNYTVLDTGRYELVMDLVEERDHSVVFFNWGHQKSELIRIAEAREIPYAVIDGKTPVQEREQITKHYQAGFYRVLFAHPQSAGHGLTLTRGRTTIWASPTYNLEHFQQGNRRIYRISQTQKTETIVIVAPGTVDERVYKALQGKQVRMDALLKELQCSTL